MSVVRDDGGVDEGRRPAAPAEGWSALVLTALLALVVAAAIDDPAWVNGRGSLTDCLPLCAALGLVVGIGGPKLGWGRWTTHILGALFAALVIPVIAGWTMVPGTSVGDAYRITAHGTLEAYLDLGVRGLRFTTQEVHYLLVLGGLCWATAQFLGYAVVGHRQPLSAVLVAGVVLLVNMLLTGREQLLFLVVYAAAALFLLVGMHALDERGTWMRRRIGDPGAIAALYLRGGAIFIVVAVAGSLLLAERAASAPLGAAWDGVDDQLIRWGQELQRFFPAGGDFRGVGGVTFGATAQIPNRWFNDNGVAFTARVPTSVDVLHWRAATYDTFALKAWLQTGVTAFPASAGDPLLDGTSEAPDPAFTTTASTTITPDGYHDNLVLSPGIPVTVSRAANVLLQGDDYAFAGVVLPDPGSGYDVQSAVLNVGGSAGLTANELRAASTDYPASIAEMYTDVPDGAIGPKARQLLDQVLAAASPAGVSPDNPDGVPTPYDLASFMQAYLSSDANFRYTTDLSAYPCDDASAVECFAFTRHGYCLHYASTMAILMRAAYPDNPIPTRLVQGFLPGVRAGATMTVRNRDAHAWVEVYFPGYGWIPFDPTGGEVGRPSVLPPGAPVASAQPTPPTANGTSRPRPTRRTDTEPGTGGPTGPAGANRPGDRTVFILLAGLLVLLLGAGIAVAWVRGPRGEITPDSAWRTLVRLAGRVGAAPRPTQTVYEYTDGLARLVPAAREDLAVVATARVETVYAKVQLAPDRLDAVKQAMRRLRPALVRLVFRARPRGGRPGRRRR